MKRVFAALMIAIGLLIAGLSGLCTAVFSLTTITTAPRPSLTNAYPVLLICLVIGAPFIAAGVGLILGGLYLWKRRPKEPRADVF